MIVLISTKKLTVGCIEHFSYIPSVQISLSFVKSILLDIRLRLSTTVIYHLCDFYTDHNFKTTWTTLKTTFNHNFEENKYINMKPYEIYEPICNININLEGVPGILNL